MIFLIGWNKMIKIIVDPTEHFHNLEDKVLLEHCNVVISWAVNPIFSKSTFKASILQQYLYNLSDFCMGGEVGNDGVYRYEGDEPLYPLICLEKGDDILYFYEYDIIALKDSKQEKGFYITRVD